MITMDDVLKIVEDVSPRLFEVIKKNTASSVIIMTLIAKAFEAKLNDPQDIFHKIKNTPDYKLIIKKIEYDHEQAISMLCS